MNIDKLRATIASMSTVECVKALTELLDLERAARIAAEAKAAEVLHVATEACAHALTTIAWAEHIHVGASAVLVGPKARVLELQKTLRTLLDA
jgi:hypothetical protein